MNTPNQIQQAAAQELLKRKSALEDMHSFREYMAATYSEDFKHPPAAHHGVMIRELERLERGDIRRLLILAPPGSAKSTYCSIQYPLWRLARSPNLNILCASNSESLAENFNRRRRNIALTPQWMTLSGTKLAADLQGVGHFGTEREGSIRAAGVGSAIVGFRSHVNILDDPITGVEQALSSVQLEKQWDWFHSEFRTRLVPSGRELIVSTRWAKKDIAGRILDLVKEGKEQWTVIRLPMLADSENDPLGRADGDPLWPEYFGPAFIEEKQQNFLLWMTQFQQKPLDDSGAWITETELQYEDRAPDRLNYVIGVDLALSVGRGDYTAIVVCGVDSERNIHIVEVQRERTTPDVVAERLFELTARYEPSEVFIDDDNASRVLTRMIYELGRGRRGPAVPFNTLPLAGKDKETRAAAIRGWFLQKRVYIVRAPWNATLCRELLEFPSSDHDDQVDALSLIGRRLVYLSAPHRDETALRDPYEGFAFRPNPTGGWMTTATLDELWETAPRDRSRRV